MTDKEDVKESVKEALSEIQKEKKEKFKREIGPMFNFTGVVAIFLAALAISSPSLGFEPSEVRIITLIAGVGAMISVALWYMQSLA